ncbi:hypothetical protein L873DRAFT_1818438 [Choiromyces venosus 120613-1]|uniref:Uncharacterized protein n=1 Tax=Choiromyces venosus 120613-1 TaxID=1336337 RepID=A0A3N4J3Z7_9PEZI|nr:hypothetical protein L873DRAFT_1818438 [Choiromyces venosus 120613-1]
MQDGGAFEVKLVRPVAMYLFAYKKPCLVTYFYLGTTTQRSPYDTTLQYSVETRIIGLCAKRSK